MVEVPFFRPDIGDAEVEEVVRVLRSGWITTGPKVRELEREFARSIGATHAVAVNSGTAALHLAIEALGLQAGEGVLVPTMTFAATAEVVRYLGAVPILVDCDPISLNMDLEDASRKLADLKSGRLPVAVSGVKRVAGVIPVYVGGEMMDVAEVRRWARAHGLWVVEDAAHAFPAAWRPAGGAPWQRCGEATADVTCFSFYANKTITTGEGGMAVAEDRSLADRMRAMSLHGLSNDAWERYSGGKSWDYRIMAPGYKYNLTDIAAAIGIHQLARAETLRLDRESVAEGYRERLAKVDELELPRFHPDRRHAWHLFPVRLRLERLSIDRNAFMEELKAAGVGCSVHWRPLHLHPYYEKEFGWRPEALPQATAVWERLVSLPIFPGMTEPEIDYVAEAIQQICARASRPSASVAAGAPR